MRLRSVLADMRACLIENNIPMEDYTLSYAYISSTLVEARWAHTKKYHWVKCTAYLNNGEFSSVKITSGAQT